MTKPAEGWMQLLVDIQAMQEDSVGMSMTLDHVISSDPDTLGGIPVFAGTLVPFKNLIDCLQAGDSIDLFLSDFPTVSREQVIAALEVAKEQLLGFVGCGTSAPLQQRRPPPRLGRY